MLVKQLASLAIAKAAGIVLHARVPNILTSRANSTETRRASFAIALKLARAKRTTTKAAIHA